MATSDRFTFQAEWKDSLSSTIWQFYLFFYPSDGTLELFDVRKQRLFLKRTKFDEINVNDLYIGARLCICSRLISIEDYGDSYTRSKFEYEYQKTCGLMKPEVGNRKGEIIKHLVNNNLNIVGIKTIQLTQLEAFELYQEYEDKAKLSTVVEYITHEPVVAFEVIGVNSIMKLFELAGPADPEKAKSDYPDSLRAIFGIDKIKNGIHVSVSADSYARDRNILFNKKPFAYVKNTTCCVIKPHAVREGKAGDIIDMIEKSGYEITGINTCTLNVEEAEKFYEVYKYVTFEYQRMVQELSCRPCIALEIRPGSEEESITKFRELIGPHDYDIAKMIRPNCIRAKFGNSKVQNAVHVTDLIEDASREVEYFFKNIC